MNVYLFCFFIVKPGHSNHHVLVRSIKYDVIINLCYAARAWLKKGEMLLKPPNTKVFGDITRNIYNLIKKLLTGSDYHHYLLYISFCHNKSGKFFQKITNRKKLKSSVIFNNNNNHVEKQFGNFSNIHIWKGFSHMQRTVPWDPTLTRINPNLFKTTVHKIILGCNRLSSKL